MEKSRAQYRMHTLMNYTELEALSAQKKAGSNSAYFHVLDEFEHMAPRISANLKAPRDPQQLEVFLQDINLLQQQLLAVGSSTLFWLAEKAIEAANEERQARCDDTLFLLSKRISALCDLLDEAKMIPEGTQQAGPGKAYTAKFGQAAAPQAAHRQEPDTEQVVAESSQRGKPDRQQAEIKAGQAKAREQAAQKKEAGRPQAAKEPLPAQGTKRPQAPVKPELFEKLGILIENFEKDEALSLLHSLLAFSYTDSIDVLLISIYKALSQFDYAGAAKWTKKLLQNTKEIDLKENQTRKKKILAVDDIPDALNTVMFALKKDYSIYGVTNHMAALKFLMNNTVDLILLDIEMPDMNGFVLLGIIRKIKVYEKIPVLFITGNVNMENIKKAYSAGGNDFIKKPIDTEVLLEKIKKNLAFE